MTVKTFHHLKWDISFLKNNPIISAKEFGIPQEAKNVSYSIRLLRYWFGYHLLREEFEHKKYPLNIAEIGVDTGQMLSFTKSALSVASANTVPLPWKNWVGIDAILKKSVLHKAGYKELISLNLENPSCTIPLGYDVIILLHVLEHLLDPEEALRKIAKSLRPGGVIIGGSPSLPDWLIASRQTYLRKKSQPMGHVSVFSPQHMFRLAKIMKLQTEFLTGAFLFRRKGSRLENSPNWLRLNLAWGALFPAWPGEIYWRMRKPL